MAFLTDYYAGRAGAEDLRGDDIQSLVMAGEPLRYKDSSRIDDRTLRENREMGATTLIPTERGGYKSVGPAPGVNPGGTKTIGAADALARWSDGSRPVDDPGGVLPQLQRQAYAQSQARAMQVADQLSQYLPPERVLEETMRMTGVDLRRSGVDSTPKGLERRQSELGLSKTRAETEKIGADTANVRATAAETAEDTLKKRNERLAAPVDEYNRITGIADNLNRMEETAVNIRDNPALWRATGFLGLYNVPGSESRAIAAQMKSLTSQTARQTLQEIRDASKTGGALGNVSDKDISLLETAIANLDLSQSTEAVRESIDNVVAYTKRLRSRMESGYERKFGTPKEGFAQPNPPKAALKDLREGAVTTFGNGQQWTLKNGAATRVK